MGIPRMVEASAKPKKPTVELTTKRLGSIIYTGPYRHYDTLVCCVGSCLPLEYFQGPKIELPVESGSKFWAFSNERLSRFHGVTRHRFPFYLKELELRYNTRDSDLFSVLARQLCDFVPNID